MSSEKLKNESDMLDRTVAFLQKRDGIDKTLKICRYSAKLILATALRGSKSEISLKLKNFEASVGVSRKAYRLGKFLQDVNTVRKTPLSSIEGILELVASTGEGVYYFIEQFVWLVKAGALDKRHSRQLQKVSAWAEFIGYFGSVTLKSMQIAALMEAESNLLSSLKDVDGKSCQLTKGENSTLLKRLESVRLKRLLKTLSVVQDLADSLLALNDIWEGEGLLARPALLAGGGLLSALISAHKNWLSV